MTAFDSQKVLAEWKDALRSINAEERLLLEEYDSLCADLQSWSKAKIIGDTQRAQKRLRLSIDVVQTEEGALLDKQEGLSHCIHAIQSTVDRLVKQT